MLRRYLAANAGPPEVLSGMNFADIIRADATERLRECEAFDCEGLLIDMSRNGSKRFCSVRCGNRMNMVAWRDRQTSRD